MDADLRIDVGGHSATVQGHGQEIRIFTDRPAALLDEVAGAALPAGVGRVSGPRSLGRLADLLDTLGLRLTVSGPDGPIARVGGGEHSVLGRVVTGSPAVRFGSPRALAPLVARQLDRRVLAGVGVGVVAALAVVLRRRR